MDNYGDHRLRLHGLDTSFIQCYKGLGTLVAPLQNVLYEVPWYIHTTCFTLILSKIVQMIFVASIYFWTIVTPFVSKIKLFSIRNILQALLKGILKICILLVTNAVIYKVVLLHVLCIQTFQRPLNLAERYVLVKSIICKRHCLASLRFNTVKSK